MVLSEYRFSWDVVQIAQSEEHWQIKPRIVGSRHIFIQLENYYSYELFTHQLIVLK